jgi:photosystem II stability/assembly factor-like uncharacterized protein
MAWPTALVGYVTVQNYDRDPANTRRVVACTTDGGETWEERTVIEDHAFREFGVGFVDAQRGWIGGSTTGVQTEDGGRTWTPVAMGQAVNKIRVLRDAGGVSVFAIGVEMHKLELSA